MNVKSLTELLETQDQGRSIRFDFGQHVGTLASWRGRYEELTLTWARKPTTVAAVVADLRAAPGKAFQGYKGGDFIMRDDTPVWADDYGDCFYHGVMGCAIEDGEVLLITADLSDYA